MGKLQHWVGIGIIILVIASVFWPRLDQMDAHRSPDEKRWVANTSGFTTKLAFGQIDQLLQQAHPGITTQWLGALTVRYDSWELKRLPLVAGQGVLLLGIAYIFGRLWGLGAGVAVLAFLNFNPLLYAHTRVYAMDSLLALFTVASLGLLLLWLHNHTWRYLIAAGVATAAAILSKLPGVVLIPLSLAVISIDQLRWDHWRFKGVHLRPLLVWGLATLVGLGLILPAVIVVPHEVVGDIKEFMQSDNYLEEHTTSSWYYVRSLIFFSTPIHLALLVIAPLWWWIRRPTSSHSRMQPAQLLVLVSGAILVIIMMSVGLKKGDRYILPAFALMDVIAAAITVDLARLMRHRVSQPTVRRTWLTALSTYTVIGLLLWQAFIIIDLHPHALAYINPITRPAFAERRHGWGEGLDLAAAYLNSKPGAGELKVASYYPNEFGVYFQGEAVPVHQHDNPSVDYVVLYRAMLERGPDAWETDVFNQYRERTPEKVISFGSVPFVWIYAAPTSS